MGKEIARRYLLYGRVQGVGFRFFAEREAARLNIRGYVRNLRDGSVEVYAIGSEGALAALKAQLAQGPIGARVTRLEQAEALVEKSQRGFSIEG